MEVVVSACLWRCPGETVQLRRFPALPHPPSLVSLSGVFWPLATTGAIPRTGVSGIPAGPPGLESLTQ